MSKQLECAVERHDGVVVIKPVGRLDSGQVPRFEEIVNRQVRSGHPDVILDFGQLTFISSSALRILLAAAKYAKSKKAAFLLCALMPHITDLMRTAGFDRLLSIRRTRDEALRETGKAAPAPAAEVTLPGSRIEADDEAPRARARLDARSAPRTETPSVYRRLLATIRQLLKRIKPRWPQRQRGEARPARTPARTPEPARERTREQSRLVASSAAHTAAAVAARVIAEHGGGENSRRSRKRVAKRHGRTR